MYQYYNANPLKNRVSDCVIRAISVAERKTWDETYRELSKLAQKDGILLDDVDFVEPLLDKRYRRICCKDMYVRDFVDSHPYGTYLITMNGHITCCMNGTIYDTFDCLDRKMRCAWLVK